MYCFMTPYLITLINLTLDQKELEKQTKLVLKLANQEPTYFSHGVLCTCLLVLVSPKSMIPSAQSHSYISRCVLEASVGWACH